jgi:glycosyltransferase involved in cell wall biosynthesis
VPNTRNTAKLSAFGQSICLETGPNDFARDDSLWRTREVYERFFAVHQIPDEGLALDVGAGFGGFAIPFAKAWPAWTVLALEPDRTIFDALCRNITELGLTNVIASNVAVGKADNSLSEELLQAVGNLDAEAIKKFAIRRRFSRKRNRHGGISVGKERRGLLRLVDFQPSFDAVPVNALQSIEPAVLKFTCPGLEDELLEALSCPSLKFVVGEAWEPPCASRLYAQGCDELRAYVPIAGRRLRLSRDPDEDMGRAGLDVVVAMYNTPTWIVDCVSGIIENDALDVRAIVVDDGSTDDSAQVVAREFGSHPRVKMVSKPNGGCASARNFGRLNSDATHIAFVDADDVPSPDLFPALLDLARYTGTGVVQGGYDLLYQENGQTRYEPSEEAAAWSTAKRLSFGRHDYFFLRGQDLIAGRPTIWRRVYRRDFLDSKNIWFPEHIRAFDDQIFHMLTLYYSETLFCTDQVRYHYRQHAKQDIRQGDERMFASLEMYRLVLRRAVQEGWEDFAPFVCSFVNTLNWTIENLRPDLQEAFINGGAELWSMMAKVFPDGPFEKLEQDGLQHDELRAAIEASHCRLSPFDCSHSWAFLDAVAMHPDLVRNAARTWREGF